MANRLSSSAGFTLLETMIAMAIMMVAFASIIMVENSSIQNAIKSKQMNVVGMLARNAMMDAEFKVQGKTFDEIQKEEGGTFPTPFEDYTWKRTIKEVEFPNLGQKAPGQGSDEAQNQAAELLGKLVTSFLSKALREMTVTVFWKKGSGEQSFSVTTYWVNLNHEFQLTE